MFLLLAARYQSAIVWTGLRRQEGGSVSAFIRYMGQFSKEQFAFLKREAKERAKRDGGRPSVARTLREIVEAYREKGARSHGKKDSPK